MKGKEKYLNLENSCKNSYLLEVEKIKIDGCNRIKEILLLRKRLKGIFPIFKEINNKYKNYDIFFEYRKRIINLEKKIKMGKPFEIELEILNKQFTQDKFINNILIEYIEKNAETGLSTIKELQERYINIVKYLRKKKEIIMISKLLLTDFLNNKQNILVNIAEILHFSNYIKKNKIKSTIKFFQPEFIKINEGWTNEVENTIMSIKSIKIIKKYIARKII